MAASSGDEKCSKLGKNSKKWVKVGQNPKKPVEIGFFSLTKISESRIVNGGRVL